MASAAVPATAPAAVPDAIRAVCDNCALIGAIIDRARNENYLTHFERNALLYVFGHIYDGWREFLHSVISNCINYNFEVTEGFISRIKENPVSCGKLKLRFSEKYGGVCGECVFEDYPLFYPSPVIHALRISADAAAKPLLNDNVSRLAEIAKASDFIRLNSLAEKLLEVSKRKRDAEKDFRICCEELEEIFEAKGITEYEASVGKLIHNNGEWLIKVV